MLTEGKGEGRRYFYTSKEKVNKDSFEYNLYKALSMLGALGVIESMVKECKQLEDMGAAADYPTEGELLMLYRKVVKQVENCLSYAVDDVQSYTLSHNDGRMMYSIESCADTCDADGEPTGCTAGYDEPYKILSEILEDREVRE